MDKPAVDRSVLELIRRVIMEEAGRLGVKVERIILFGSRARGDYREDSDWDILVVVKEEIDWRARRRLSIRVRRRLLQLLGRPVDLIIEDIRTFTERSRYLGSIEEAALKEGVTA